MVAKRMLSIMLGLLLASSFCLGQQTEEKARVSLRAVDLDGKVETSTREEQAPVVRLDDRRIRQLLSRLSAMPVPEVDTIALPPNQLPPPLPGTLLETRFGEGKTTEPVPTFRPFPPEVVRLFPSGNAGTVKQVGVVFSKPMVAIGDLESAPVPLRLKPLPPDGRWRWVDPLTAIFETKQPFPAATAFELTVTDAVDMDGLALVKGARQTFETTRPFVTGHNHRWQIDLNPLKWLRFNVPIEPKSVIAHISFRFNGDSIPARLATNEEIAAGREENPTWDIRDDGTEIWFKPSRVLPRGKDIAIHIEPGVTGLTGPLPMVKEHASKTKTFPAMALYQFKSESTAFLRSKGREKIKVEGSFPWTDWTFEFTNPLAETFSKDLIRIEPPLPRMSVRTQDSIVTVYGVRQPGVTYRLSLSPDIQDIYGQRLGKTIEETVTVKSAPPNLGQLYSQMAILDPILPPIYRFLASGIPNAKVTIYPLHDDNMESWHHWSLKYGLAEEPGKPLAVIPLTLEASKTWPWVEIDLAPYLKHGVGKFAIEVFGESAPDIGGHVYHQNMIQVTNLGAMFFAMDGERVLLWVTDLKRGGPVAGAKVRVFDTTWGTWKRLTGQTDQNGLLKLPLSDLRGHTRLIEISHGKDSVILKSVNSYIDRYFDEHQRHRDVIALSDRDLYRPGESGFIKGWVRQFNFEEQPELVHGTILYELFDLMDTSLGKGEAVLTDWGGFHVPFTVPENAAMGEVTAHWRWRDDKGNEEELDDLDVFVIQAFRQPEFEVSLALEPDLYLAGDTIETDMSALYYTGGPLPNAKSSWQAKLSNASFQPPGWDGFSFGTETRPWESDVSDSELAEIEFTGITDRAGKQRKGFVASGFRKPVSLTVDVAVTDLNQQKWRALKRTVVHPSEVTVGLRTNGYFIGQGDAMEVEVIVTDLHGNARAGSSVELITEKLVWQKTEQGRWQQKITEKQSHKVRSGEMPVTASLRFEGSGSYRLRAIVHDGSGRPSETVLRRYVSGSNLSGGDRKYVNLIPDQETYHPGDVAKVMVQAPFYPADLLIDYGKAVPRNPQTYRLESPSTVIEIPIEEDLYPGITIKAEMVGRRDRLDGPMPGFFPKKIATARGEIALPISLRSRKLRVNLTPESMVLLPGASSEMVVQVLDHTGQPLADAEVSLAIVDESVLALSAYAWKSPLNWFYRETHLRWVATHGLGQIYTEKPATVFEFLSRTKGPGLSSQMMKVWLYGQWQQYRQKKSSGVVELSKHSEEMVVSDRAYDNFGALSAIAEDNTAWTVDGVNFVVVANTPTSLVESGDAVNARSNFNPLAMFEPTAMTGSDGKVTIPFTLPDNLTRYRVMAVAVHGATHAGSSEAVITARKPLMVRPSAPRFLNLGDRFQLPVTVQNQSNQPRTIDLAVRPSNLALTDGNGWRVDVPANDRALVYVPAAALKPGDAMIQVIAEDSENGAVNDAAISVFPAWTPASSEAYAQYGEIDENGIQVPIDLPEGIYTETGGLKVTTSSTALQALTDAYLYLDAYPYGCTEQVSSRLLSKLALADVLQAFGLIENPEAVSRSIRADLNELKDRLRNDGAFSYWPGSNEVNVFASIHASIALAEAQHAGYKVPGSMNSDILDALTNRWVLGNFPKTYGSVTTGLQAYALVAAAKLGKPRPKQAVQLAKQCLADGAALEVLAWILPNLPEGSEEAAQILAQIENKAVISASTASFNGGYNGNGYHLFFSQRRQEAVILDALIQVAPDHDLIPKLTKGLMAHRRKGRWNNTQENVFALLAMNRYFRLFEAVEPDFIARVWLGESYAGQETFAGRDTTRRELNMPMAWLHERGDRLPLTITKEGMGRLYYRIGLDWTPADFTLSEKSAGFRVQRTYESVDDPDDVRRDEDGRWLIRAGATVKIKLTMSTLAKRYNIALSDPLPAGFEPLNPNLAGVSVPDETHDDVPFTNDWWHGTWYDHQNLRDERAEAFTEYLGPGTYTYSYFARATTVGEFLAPPANAEEMYMPETFGRTATERVIVIAD